MAQYTKLKKGDIVKITERYGLVVNDFSPIEGGAGNSSFLVHTPQGKHVLTVFDDKPLAYVDNTVRLLSLLAIHDFPTTRVVPLPAGGSLTAHAGKPVMLKTYIPGGVRADLDDDMLRAVGAAMARLHQIPAPDFLPDQHPFGLQLFPEVIGKNIDPEYEGWLARRLSHLQAHIPTDLPRGLIHGDLFYDNVLFEGDRFKAIIDFEEACAYYKVFDLGMAVVGMCTATGAVNLAGVGALVQGYEQVRPLPPAERDSLPLFSEYAAIATSYWRFWKYNIHDPMPAKANKHHEMMQVANVIAQTTFSI